MPRAAAIVGAASSSAAPSAAPNAFARPGAQPLPGAQPRAEQRAAELSTTSVPTPFRVAYESRWVGAGKEVERGVQRAVGERACETRRAGVAAHVLLEGEELEVHEEAQAGNGDEGGFPGPWCESIGPPGNVASLHTAATRNWCSSTATTRRRGPRRA